MMRIHPIAHLLAALGVSFALSACTEEDPTDIGGALLPAGEVVTFEVILDPAQYMRYDTAFSGYTTAIDFGGYQVMRQFEGVTNANAVFRYPRPPATAQVRDSSGTVRTDTLVRYPSGYLLIQVDTTASRGSATFGVYQTAQSFDSRTATWTVRSDTGGVRELWQTPGGTKGPLIGTVTWSPGQDSVIVPLDSATIVALTDTANKARGALVTLDQAGAGGSSLRLNAVSMRLSGRSSIRADTILVTTVAPEASTFLFTPDPPLVSGGLIVSGVPAWRGALGFRDDLRNVVVPCPGTGCTIRLSQAHINLAEVLLQPTGSAAGFSPEDSIFVGALTLLESPNVPLSRSPLGDPVGTVRQPIPRGRFTNADTGPATPLQITAFVTRITQDTATTAQGSAPRSIALITTPESATFGFASFRPGPRLRLVLTLSTDQ